MCRLSEVTTSASPYCENVPREFATSAEAGSAVTISVKFTSFLCLERSRNQNLIMQTLYMLGGWGSYPVHGVYYFVGNVIEMNMPCFAAGVVLIFLVGM